MIKITRELSKVRGEGILSIYGKMIENDDIDQLEYVNGKILQKIAILENSRAEMERYICLTILKKQSPPTYKHINNFIRDSNI